MKKSIGAKDIVFPAPVFVIGTYCMDGKPNAMNVAWGGICSSTPPCIAISVRKSRCTYDNIVREKAFTVNIPSVKYIKEADYCGLVSGKDVNKFEILGLIAVKGYKVNAPYISEYPLNIECKLVDVHKIGGHYQFVGEIVDIKVEEECLDEEGLPDINMVNPMIFDPARYTYNSIGPFLEKAFSVGKRR